MPAPVPYPASLLLPWLAPTLLRSSRALHSHSHGPVPPDKPAPKKTVTDRALIEELFPDLVPPTPPSRPSSTREIPRLIIPKDLDDLSLKTGGSLSQLKRPGQRFVRRVNNVSAIELFARPRGATREPARAPPAPFTHASDGSSASPIPGVLLLQGASRSLHPDDFHRITPRGTHIATWRSEGSIIRIIPTRHPKTFEQQEQYLLIFESEKSAALYQQEAMRRHMAARGRLDGKGGVRLPGGLDGKEGLIGDDEGYALLPGSATMSLKLLERPYNNAMDALIQRGGYERLVGDGWEHETPGVTVGLWFDLGQGQKVGTQDIRELIEKEGGSTRGATNWRLIEIEELARASKRVSEEITEEVVGKQHHGPETFEGEEEALNAYSMDTTRYGTRKWLARFRDESDARRFVRYRHRTEVPRWQSHSIMPVLNAEIIW